MPGGTSTRESSEAIRMEPLGRTSSSRSPGQNGTANTTEVPVNSGDSNTGLHKRNIYEHNGVVCSQKRALCITTVVFAILFAISLIIAFAGPQNDCPCVGEKPANLEIEDDEKSSVPLATNGEVFPWNNVRLPTFAHPTRYNITIHPNLTTLEVKGQVTIEFYVDKETNYIVFHSKNLTMNEKMVQDRKGHRLKIAKLLEYPKHQQLYLELEESKFRKRGNYSVHLRFISKLTSELEGFYLSSYVTPEGEKRYLATTHFEPTYARSAFPCFDEPQFKAKFKVSIFRDRFHIALCNMPVMNTEDAGFYMGTGLLRDDFQESVEMSTYLVAFVVCDFKRVSELTKRNISVSVYAAEAMLSQAKYAVNTAARTMDYFESFFGVHYPLPKQDLIAIPDFAAGAMENWGLITYRETSILYDPQETSTNAHEWVAVVVAHELAHQWFGNLVTMKWWNDLWLNEGAASFFEYKGVNYISPEWSMMDQFILDKIQPALDLDALTSSHPISVPVKDPNEIEAIFDDISYSKGASILNMLEGFLCEEVLKSGLNDYLNSHAYGNADTNDLWAVFTKHANHTFDVKAIMDTWTQQMGFPLITITRDGNSITATQKRFLISPKENDTELLQPKSPFDYKWDYVPWATALGYLHSWKGRLSESPGYKRYIMFLKRLLTPVTKYVGWADEGTHLKKLLRIAVLQSAVSVKLDDVVKPAKTLFENWMFKGERVAPNIRDVIYVAGIKFGGEEEWNHCWQNYQKTQVPSEKRIMLQALGATTDSWLLQRYLLHSLNRDIVRSQDVETVIASVASNPEGQFLAWRHLKAYWPQIHALFGNGSLTMGGLISVVISDFFKEYDYHEVSEFFKKVDVGSGQRALEQSLETIKFNIHWVKENADVVDRWLINYLNVHTS
ncbi:glutamyl aminopeptidase isoform X5 [Ptiloglossa arizonensis]|uniref:glutamyl aminopeptidase isoform X5 n=1 Tax=Ptiloglossa arizonensis TaxID=3350558 RepID=UPI003FA01DDE